MYELYGFIGKLKIQNYENSVWNYVHYMHGLSGFVEKLNFANTLNVQNRENAMGICVL